MDIQDICKAIGTIHKGANIVCEWTRPAKVRATNTLGKVEKRVRAIGRMGLDYDNLSSVQDKRESGNLPAVSGGLPWGEWAIFPYLIAHKGAHYVRLYNGTCASIKPHAEWLLNGEPVDVETVRPVLLASETAEKEKGDCFTVRADYLTRLGMVEG